MKIVLISDDTSYFLFFYSNYLIQLDKRNVIYAPCSRV